MEWERRWIKHTTLESSNDKCNDYSTLKNVFQDKNQWTRVSYSQDIQSILTKLIVFNIQVCLLQIEKPLIYRLMAR